MNAGKSESSRGLFGGVRHFVVTLIGLIQNRLELFTIELEEEKIRLIELALWGVVTAILGFMALLVGSLTLVCLFWAHRVAVLIGLTAAYALGTLAGYLVMRKKMKDAPVPFSALMEEIRKDGECWRESE